VVSAAEGGPAVVTVDGAMVDKPVLDRARLVLEQEEAR
jgi:citrate lyase beta subunit